MMIDRMIAQYCATARLLAPKLAALAKLRALIAQRAASLAQREDRELKPVRRRLNRARVAHADAQGKHAVLRREEARLRRIETQAQTLLASLRGMHGTCQEELTQLTAAMTCVAGDALVFACVTAHAAQCCYAARSSLRDALRALCAKHGVATSVTPLAQGVLAYEPQCREWTAPTDSGTLPAHPSFVEAAAITLATPRFPLVVDPQGMALEWLRRTVTRSC
jgi:hypothetical protein